MFSEFVLVFALGVAFCFPKDPQLLGFSKGLG